MRRFLLLVPLLLMTSDVLAQVVVRTLDLGDGITLSAETRSPGVCALLYGPCTTWHATGLDIARMDGLLVARTFARVPGTERIVAAVPHRGGPWRSAGLLFTDDRGGNWQAARWPSANAAEAIAFSPDAAVGYAVGPSRSVWLTTDRGLSWVERTSSAGVSYVDVAALGSALVVVDEAHDAFRSRDRGFSFESLASGVDGPLEIEGDFVVARAGGRRFRVSSDGRLRAE